MNKYNLDKLIKVETIDFKQTDWYSFKPDQKVLGILIQKEGVYSYFPREWVGITAPEDYTLKDKVVYINPRVILHYEADHSKVYYFSTLKEAEDFTKNITKVGKWIS